VWRPVFHARGKVFEQLGVVVDDHLQVVGERLELFDGHLREEVARAPHSGRKQKKTEPSPGGGRASANLAKLGPRLGLPHVVDQSVADGVDKDCGE